MIVTVNTTNITSGPYTGNGTTSSFSYTFRVDTKSELTVYETTDAVGALPVALTVDVDYTVNNIGTDGGGTIDRIAGALPTDYTWYIRSNRELTQETDFESQGGFFPDVHEAALDKLTFLIQELLDLNSRSFRLSESDPDAGTVNLELPAVSDRADKILTFDSAGDLTVVEALGVFRGTWTTATIYSKRDIYVDPDNGNVYYVQQDHTSTTVAADVISGYVELFVDASTVASDIIADSIQLSGGTGTQGTVSWNTDEETLDLICNGAVLQLGQELYYHVRNNTGSTIADGTPVMATGTIGASSRITIAPMDTTDIANAKYFLGVTTETLADGDDGKVTQFGKIRGIDTSLLTEGNVLWLSGTGSYTETEPTSGLRIPFAFVVTSHASNGTIFVRANTGTTFHESHDVVLTTPATDDGLVYNAVSEQWENRPNALFAGVTKNLTAGYTTDTETLASDTITPDMTAECVKTRTMAGNLTINMPTGGNGVCHIILTVDASDRTVTLGTNVNSTGGIPTLTASTVWVATVIRVSATYAVVRFSQVD